MKYHVLVFNLDMGAGDTQGQYVKPHGGTLDAYLENEAQEGYRLECMVNLPDALATKLRVVTIHND